MTDALPEATTLIRHVVVLGHPALGSFNHEVAERYCHTVRENGQEAVLRDPYALDLDPCLRAAARPATPPAVGTCRA